MGVRLKVLAVTADVVGDSFPATGRDLTPGGTVPAKFTLSKDKAGKFWFTITGNNGQMIAKSQGYATKASALNGVASLRKNASGAILDDTTAARPSTRIAKTVKPAAKSSRKPAAKKPAAKKAAAKKAGTARPATKKVTRSAPATKASAKRSTTAPARKSAARRSATPTKTMSRRTVTRTAARRATKA
jgi:uncharacterized protein YegP (UPF0339 family)